MIENKFERVADDDPNRCQALGGVGQCPFKAVEGQKNCARHGGTNAQTVNKKENIRVYRAAQWAARIAEHAENPKIKTLREELGIMRILVETLLNKCVNETDLIINSSKIADLVSKIEKLTTSTDKLESKLGMTLDQSQIINLANVIIDIIANHVEDETVRETIANEIINAITATGE